MLVGQPASRLVENNHLPAVYLGCAVAAEFPTTAGARRNVLAQMTLDGPWSNWLDSVRQNV
jgi:hypothetical protein